jgi:predicted phosphate transport protein (TIGR00153 family)
MFGIKTSDQAFFDAMAKHADTTARAAKILVEQFENMDKAQMYADRIEGLEHDGDRIVHETMNRLRETWITPFDRTDIRTMVSKTDDVLDLIHTASMRVVLFELKGPAEDALALARNLLEACEVASRAVAMLNNLKRSEEILRLTAEINRIENQGDDIFRKSIAKLYKPGRDPVDIMKWREVLDDLEFAMDRCEDVADAIGGVVLEYS